MLSIVIPSYRPTNYLKETLNSLEAAGQYLNRPVNVYLCLNGRSSNNQISSQIVLSNYKNINLITTSSVVTNDPAQSLNFAISQARETYVWVMSDDDTVEEFSLQKITNILRHKELTIGLVNFNTIDSSGQPITHNVQGWMFDRTYEKHDLDISIKETNFCYGSFSSLIINRKKWAKTDYVSKNAPGGMNFMLQAPQLMSMGTHTLIAEPLYNYRLYEKRWQKNYNSTFYIDHIVLPQLIPLYSQFSISNEAIHQLKTNNSRGLIQSLYNLKMFGKLDLKLAISTLQHNYKNRYLYPGLLLLIMPKIFLQYLKSLKISDKFKVRW